MMDRSALFRQVAAGTPMGQYLRCFWYPIAALSELTRSRSRKSACSKRISRPSLRRRNAWPDRGPLCAPRCIAIMRYDFRISTPLRLSRLGVRHDGSVHRYAARRPQREATLSDRRLTAKLAPGSRRTATIHDPYGPLARTGVTQENLRRRRDEARLRHSRFA